MYGVITADIIGSTRIKEDNRKQLPELIYQITGELQKVCPLKVEIYRGDSFQVLVEAPELAPLVAVLYRAGLRKSELLAGSTLLDARMAVGVGGVDYEDEHLTLSNGEAFILSGHEFDRLGKRRLSIVTPSSEVNAELFVETAFLDNVITHWTQHQSECIYQSLLTNAKHAQLASNEKTTRQNVGRKLIAARERLVRLYLERASYIIREKI